MSTPGSANNVQWGFNVGTTSVVTISADVGMLDGAVTARVVKTHAFLRADQYAMNIDNTVVDKQAFIAFTMKEVSGENLAHAWGTGSYSGSSVLVNSSDEGQSSVEVVTTGPDGAVATLTMAKGVSIGDGTLTIPFASGQTLSCEYQAVADIANSGRLMMMVHS